MAKTLGNFDQTKSSPFPKNPQNNQFFFKHPYLFLYRAKEGIWFPIYSDALEDIELEDLEYFFMNTYPKYHDPSLSNKELAEDVSILLKGVFKPSVIERIARFIEKAHYDIPVKIV